MADDISKRHQRIRLFKIVCFDAIESTRDFASLKPDLRQVPVEAIFGKREYETYLSHSCHWNTEYETNRPMDPARIARGHPNGPFLENSAPRTVFIQAGPPTPYKQVYLSVRSLEIAKYFALLHFPFQCLLCCSIVFLASER